tara:strand:+ start:641 stop:781 length:141 start_codon:yes stop_codon:yes gene_type:complete
MFNLSDKEYEKHLIAVEKSIEETERKVSALPKKETRPKKRVSAITY